jgi:hypothetical protein
MRATIARIMATMAHLTGLNGAAIGFVVTD